MKNILKKVAGIAFVAALVLGMFGCSNGDEHIDEFVDWWEYDDSYHWHKTWKDCEYNHVKDKAEHIFDDVWTPCDRDVEKHVQCQVCGYWGWKVFPKNQANHTFSDFRTYDKTHHWYAATCEHKDVIKDKAEHVFGYERSNNDATKNKDGTKHRWCDLCGYNEDVIDEGSKLPKEVGDFILKDGTVLSKDSTPQSGTVAAVIVRAAADGKPALGVGIVHNRSGLAWCTDSAAGYSKNITELQGDKRSDYMDGSDGWEKLKAACSDAGEHPEYYPAWKYCLDYATKNGLEGDFANGWYLPTVAELYTIYQNKTAVNTSLSKAGGSQFGTLYYRSCCQEPSYNIFAWVLDFDDGDMICSNKYDGNYYVCSVRAFY